MRDDTTDRTRRSWETTAGALLGLLIGDALDRPTARGPGPIARIALPLAERLTADEYPCDEDVAGIVIDHHSADPCLDRERCRVFTPGVIAAVLAPYALRGPVTDATDRRIRRAARVLGGDSRAADAAVTLAAGIAGAARGCDPLVAARNRTTSADLRRTFDRFVELRRSMVAPAALCEHVDVWPGSADTIAVAAYCAGGDTPFALAVDDALSSFPDSCAVGACTGAISGARHGATAVGGHRGVDLAVRRRVGATASLLAMRAVHAPSRGGYAPSRSMSQTRP